MRRNRLPQMDRVIEGLNQSKINIQKIKQFLTNIEESEEARKCLMMIEFSLIEAIHKIKWIGEEETTDIELSSSSEK